MKSNHYKTFYFIALTLCLSSCTPLLYTSLDILRPAKVAFSPEATSLVFVNNSIPQPADIGHTTTLLNETTKNISVQSDSAATVCTQTLFDEINDKNFFNSTKIVKKSINKGKDFNTTPSLLPQQIKSLCTKHGTLGILTLDKIKISDQLVENFIPERGVYLPTLELICETQWSIYYAEKSDNSTIHFKDTIYWETESYFREKALQELPRREDAILEAARFVGNKCVNRFVPYWDKVDRYFYNSKNKGMKKGMDSVYVKNWKAAINNWETVLNSTKKTTLKAQAANNIAICYEIIGDVSKALEYANTAYYNFGLQTIIDLETLNRSSNYLIELSQRKKEIDALKKQLGE